MMLRNESNSIETLIVHEMIDFIPKRIQNHALHLQWKCQQSEEGLHRNFSKNLMNEKHTPADERLESIPFQQLTISSKIKKKTFFTHVKTLI